MAWVSFFGLAAVSPTAAVSRPETLAHPLVFALVAYRAAVLPLMPVLTYSARPSRRHS
jgi:hypothetical protein